MKKSVVAHKVQKKLPLVDGVKNIIAVASGKGGVGKSTTAVNLALALQAQGACVGILDADIYGPSIPTMLGIYDKPESLDGKSIEPNMAHGLQVMSIGFLVDQEAAMIWRGPMVSNALKQLLNDTRWRALDYLIVDLPPGTGDIQLTMAQTIPVSAAVIVTTPQNIALQDAKRALQMFRKVDITVLGIIENMSYHRCSACGHQEAIFGEGGANKFAQQYDTALLGHLPLVGAIRQQMDIGQPTVAALPESEEAGRYRQIALAVVDKLSCQPKASKVINIAASK